MNNKKLEIEHYMELRQLDLSIKDLIENRLKKLKNKKKIDLLNKYEMIFKCF
jgi:hypothetical protein